MSHPNFKKPQTKQEARYIYAFGHILKRCGIELPIEQKLLLRGHLWDYIKQELDHSPEASTSVEGLGGNTGTLPSRDNKETIQ